MTIVSTLSIFDYLIFHSFLVSLVHIFKKKKKMIAHHLNGRIIIKKATVNVYCIIYTSDWFLMY